MLQGLVALVREGSIVTVTAVALLSAPLPAQAGFFDDVGEILSSAPELVGGLAGVLDPRHDIGKFALGSVLAGGVGLGGLALGAMFAGTAAAIITGGAAIALVAGVGLMIWGGYNLWKAFNGDDAGGGGRPARPPSRPDTSGPGRIEPGRDNPGPGTPGSPGTIGNGGTAPGTNVDREVGTRPEPPVFVPGRGPSSTGNGIGSRDAAGINR